MRTQALAGQRGSVRLPVIISFLALMAGAIALAILFLLNDDDEGQAKLVQTEVTASATPRSEPPLGESYRMIIESIGVDAPVDTYSLDENAIPVVPTGDDAAQVVAWYDFSARPGTGGNAVYAGHVTWNGPAVFKQLASVQAGDLIRLAGADGTEIVYRVTSNESLAPDDPRALDSMMAMDRDVLTIITCGGTFFDTSDPVIGGDYSLRVIIRADRQSLTEA